jgi:hypothetical protein
MKLTFEQILNSVSSVRELREIRFPPTIALNIYELLQELEIKFKTYRDLSRDIYLNHEIPEDNGRFNLSNVDPKKTSDVLNDLEELSKQEVEIKDVSISMEDLERAKALVSPDFFVGFNWLIKTK